ncbi:MAG: NADPH-dependent F420 reductase [Acidobacteria bacterium]|nr:NADPH-dependent F420 reductase [Acidobacteriota bacterium]
MSQSAAPVRETVAILGGTGELGLGLVLRWAAAGIPIIIGSRDTAKAEAAASNALERLRATRGAAISIYGTDNRGAAAEASVVVLAVPFPGQAAILKSIQASLNNCILVDATVPLAATVGGKPTRMLGLWQGSAAEQARELVPEPVPVLAAFHNVSAEALQDSAIPLDCDILVCGDDAAAKERLFTLIKLIKGLRPVDAGSLEMARVVESMTALLISVNRQYKVHHSGIRITGLESA